ncbi:MAG: HNH endonuclease [Treponema sp.]|jgi:hypothetical protein|nr:HNH endonuclease [Treponema sp.]
MGAKVVEKFGECPVNKFLKVDQYGIVRTKEGEILQPIVVNGYPTVNCPPDSKYRTEQVHRLVAFTWLRNGYQKDKKMVVHHIDYNKTNNRVDNLLWLTEEDHIIIHGIQIEEFDEIENRQWLLDSYLASLDDYPFYLSDYPRWLIVKSGNSCYV